MPTRLWSWLWLWLWSSGTVSDSGNMELIALQQKQRHGRACLRWRIDRLARLA